MGSNATAWLCYGFEVEQGDKLRESWLNNSHEDEYARKKGWVALEHVEEKDDPEKHALWLKRLQERWALEKVCPVRLYDYGEECGGAWLCIDEAGCSADWGEFEVVRPDALVLSTRSEDAKWREQLKDHCELLGIPFKEPFWFITATYF